MKEYVLITPARDEEEFIEKTIQSVINQNVLPKKWVIINDGSVDRTGEIISKYSKDHDFILPLDRPRSEGRNFGAKALAIKYGYDAIKDLSFDFIGNLDADVSLAPSYYETVLQKFTENEKLGVVGGTRYDYRNGNFEKLKSNPNSAGGPTQFFRRKCYDEIDGYRPLRFGGIDAVAETMARMNGWEVRSFPDLEVYHYRLTSSAIGLLRGRFRAGIKYYTIGYHPLFSLLWWFYRVFYYPAIIGSLLMTTGYIWGSMRYQKEVSDEYVKFLRTEQISRMKKGFLG